MNNDYNRIRLTAEEQRLHKFKAEETAWEWRRIAERMEE